VRAGLALTILVALAPEVGEAGPAVTCHCFRNRAFDPADPAAADPYILANARSSLLSVAFGVPKATLVRAVMTGTTPEDLWIAHWSAARSGRDAAWLLAAVAETGSWRVVLAAADGRPAPVRAALAGEAPPSALAALAVDDVLAARLRADAAAVIGLRAAGATSEQVVVAVVVAPRLGIGPAQVLARYRSGRATWGSLLRDAGLEPEGIEAAVRATVR
jgi:hypothetical protein